MSLRCTKIFITYTTFHHPRPAIFCSAVRLPTVNPTIASPKSSLTLASTFGSYKLTLHLERTNLIMSNSLHNSPSSLCGISRLEDPTPDKHTITSQLHHHSRISRRRNPARREIDNRQTFQFGSFFQ